MKMKVGDKTVKQVHSFPANALVGASALSWRIEFDDKCELSRYGSTWGTDTSTDFYSQCIVKAPHLIAVQAQAAVDQAVKDQTVETHW